MSFDDLCNAIPEDNYFGVYFRQLRVRSEHETGKPGALADGMTHEALPSWYAGITFRSKLEADWAATLDAWGIRWEYEPETITLPSGARYIPDFRLPQLGTWLEVKGTGVPRIEKAVELGQTLACTCENRFACTCDWPGGQLVIVGHPPVRSAPQEDLDYEDDESWSAWRIRARRKERCLNWSSATGRTAWFTRCPDCSHAGWIAIGRCRVCRGPLAGGYAFSPGDPHLRFINSDCQVAPNPAPEEPT